MSASATRVVSAISSVTASVLLLAVPAGTAGPSTLTTPTANDFTFVLRERVGPYRYWRTLKIGQAYGRAVATFGPHTNAGKDAPLSNLCTVRWNRIGLDINFAGANPDCSVRSLRSGAWYGMRLWGARWRTARGLRVGDPAERIRERYPNARYRSVPPVSPEWWLITERQQEFGRKPLLVAEVGAGRVIAIRVPAGYVF